MLNEVLPHWTYLRTPSSQMEPGQKIPPPGRASPSIFSPTSPTGGLRHRTPRIDLSRGTPLAAPGAVPDLGPRIARLELGSASFASHDSDNALPSGAEEPPASPWARLPAAVVDLVRAFLELPTGPAKPILNLLDAWLPQRLRPSAAISGDPALFRRLPGHAKLEACVVRTLSAVGVVSAFRTLSDLALAMSSYRKWNSAASPGAVGTAAESVAYFYVAYQGLRKVKSGEILPEDAAVMNAVVSGVRVSVSSLLFLTGTLSLGSVTSLAYADIPIVLMNSCLWAILRYARSMDRDSAVEVEAVRDEFHTAALHQHSSLQALADEVRESLKAIETTVHHTSSLHPMNPALHLHHATVLHAVKTAIGNVSHLTDLLTRIYDADSDGRGLHGMQWQPNFTEFDLPMVAENIGDALSGVAEERGLELIVSCPVERGRQHLYLVIGDKDLVTQILFKVGFRLLLLIIDSGC